MPTDAYIRTMIMAGLTPSEAGIVTGVDTDGMRASFERLGWTHSRLPPHSRVKARNAIMERAQDLIGEPVDMSRSEHVMTVLALAADHCGRDVAETARLAILPLPWVDRIFGRLDLEGVWPVTDRGSGDLGPSDYERFAEICEQERTSLVRILDDETHGNAGVSMVACQ